MVIIKIVLWISLISMGMREGEMGNVKLHVMFSTAQIQFFFFKYLFSSLAHFLIGSFIFLELSWRNCLYIFEINPLSVASFYSSTLLFCLSYIYISILVYIC